MRMPEALVIIVYLLMTPIVAIVGVALVLLALIVVAAIIPFVWISDLLSDPHRKYSP